MYRLTDNPDQTINVIGQRWSWTFNYTDDDVYDMERRPTRRPGASRGTSGSGSSSQSPTSSTRSGSRRSCSRWTSFRACLQPVRGRARRAGHLVGKCAELCGIDHARMLFNVEVVSREEYEDHLEELRRRRQTGQLTTANRESNAGTSTNTGGATPSEEGRRRDHPRGTAVTTRRAAPPRKQLGRIVPSRG